MKDKTIEELWKNVLLKKCHASDFGKVQTIHTVLDNDSRQYQIFEVLVTETLAQLYKDFDWETSPVQGDGGVDFIAEKKLQNTIIPSYFPQLVIYGQIKRRNTSISEKLVLDATSNIIRYYRKNAIQEKCLYEIIHVFSTERKIINAIQKNIENIDNLHYCVKIINAEYLFKIWCLNKHFIHSIIDTALSPNEKLLLHSYIEKNKTSWDDILEFKKYIKSEIFVGKLFSCIIEIDCKLEFAFSLRVRWLPTENAKILLASPESILHSYFNVKSINNRIIFEIQFLANQVGKDNLGTLQFVSPFDHIIYEMPLGDIFVEKKYIPSFSELATADLIKELKEKLKEENKMKAYFYAIIGEGGIGKSKLIENIRIYAINQKYRSINIEHECNWLDDRNVILEMFSFLSECNGIEDLDNLYNHVCKMFGGFYNQAWDEDLLDFINGKTVKNDDIIIDCLFNLLLYVLEKEALCITFSNMHWASPSLLSTIKLLIEQINDNRLYIRHNIIFIFEGRSGEIIHIDYRNVVPYDWIEFYKSSILKQFELKKWTVKDSRFYIRSQFKQPQTLLESSELESIQNLLIQYSSGNPMHINEMIYHLLSMHSLVVDDYGKLHVLVADSSNKFSTEISDVILLRIRYYIDRQPEIMDFLIILANLTQEDYCLYHKVIKDIFKEMKLDGISFFKETGFVDLRNELFFFTHEHYKMLLNQQPISDYNSIEKFLGKVVYYNENNLSCISKIRLLLKKNDTTTSYMEKVFDEIIKELKKTNNTFEQYTLLQFLEILPLDVLNTKEYSQHKLYRFLMDGSMVLANYNEAKKYIEKINILDESDEEYYLNLIYAQKILSNIHGLEMDMDEAIEVGLESINTLEKYLNLYDSTDKLYNELILLYDRVAIEYYMAGQYEQCEQYHNTALKMLNKINEPYVRYHILYEQGVRELHYNIPIGIEHIQESLQNIPNYDFMTENQEKDLILADLLMGKLLNTKDENELAEIKRQAIQKCNELATSKEPFESIIFHWVAANCMILENNFKDAIRYNRISVMIAAKTPILSLLWKSYLNLAQTYLLISVQEDNKYRTNYSETANYYLLEAKEIIESALRRNIWTKNCFQNRLMYPLNLINYFLGLSCEKDMQFKIDAPLHLDFDGYSFFMLD